MESGKQVMGHKVAGIGALISSVIFTVGDGMLSVSRTRYGLVFEKGNFS